MQNWKLITHLLFNTYYFGVNNQWWSQWPSLFGKPIMKRFNMYQIRNNYEEMRFRACHCYFISKPQKIFPRYYKKKRSKK